MFRKTLFYKIAMAAFFILDCTSLYSKDHPKKVDWPTLRKLKTNASEVPAELKSLNGTEVELFGFIIPFEDGKDSAAEFLLVPSPQYCIHVPPPPPNQIVWVRMKKGIIPMKLAPFYVTGLLHIMTNDTPAGKVSYFMDGLSVSEFTPSP